MGSTPAGQPLIVKCWGIQDGRNASVLPTDTVRYRQIRMVSRQIKQQLMPKKSSTLKGVLLVILVDGCRYKGIVERVRNLHITWTNVLKTKAKLHPEVEPLIVAKLKLATRAPDCCAPTPRCQKR